MNPNEFEIQQYIDRIKELQTALRFLQEVMRARDRKIVKPTDTLWRVYPCGCRAAGDPPAVCPTHGSAIDYTITAEDRATLHRAGILVTGDTWRPND
jgi:hypothetical protein